MFDTEAASHERHERFLHRVVAAREVWGLKGSAGFCHSPSQREAKRDVIPFWSDRAYAARCATNEWTSFEPTAISLDSFLTRWLPGMHRDHILAGTNWSSYLIGSEIEPRKLKEELEACVQPRQPSNPAV